jgi:hypothetical protein
MSREIVHSDTDSATLEFPSFLRFVWLFWMQPITLHRRLRALGIDKPDSSAWTLLRNVGSAKRAKRRYVVACFKMLAVLTPNLAMMSAVAAHLAGLEVSMQNVVVGVAFGIAFGIAVGIAFDIAYGVAFGFALGLAFGLWFGLGFGVAVVVAFGIVVGTAFGTAISVAVGVAVDVADDAMRGVVSGVVSGVVVAVVASNVAGVAGGVASSIAFILATIRVPVFPVEVVLSTFAHLWQRLANAPTLSNAPVLFHELSYLPIPFLQSHILSNAESDPLLARRVLDACEIAPGQRKIGQRCRRELQARELETCARNKMWVVARELTGTWLPGLVWADSVLLSFSECARFITAAEASSSPHLQRPHLEKAVERLKAIGNQLSTLERRETQRFRLVVDVWERAIAELMRANKSAAAHVIPNPFYTGNPLSPDAGHEVFLGRESLVGDVESLL